VQTVGVGKKVITGAHGISVTVDRQEEDLNFDGMQRIILPGGMPGTKNLEACDTVQKAIDFCSEKGLLIAAICAAPSVLGHKGLLQNKKATCFPGFEEELLGATVASEGVVRDGRIITARGMGVALAFGLALVTALKGEEVAASLRAAIQAP
jgi:4-methyl-5(b-hydroxyethyl)-thiazole monophosphate biosynthesis